ncbi:hypothetical protein D3C86_1647050 [compost metagenome]
MQLVPQREDVLHRLAVEVMVFADLVERAVGLVPLLADQLFAIVVGDLLMQQPPARAVVRATETAMHPAFREG